MISYSEVCAFTDTPDQGNRAGVVLQADQLTEEQMQQLAEFIGVSETVFVVDMGPGVVEVRYFTPTQEVEFCGHATIALGLLLTQEGFWHGGLLELSTLAGRVPLRLEQIQGVPERVWFLSRQYESNPLPSVPNTLPSLSSSPLVTLQSDQSDQNHTQNWRTATEWRTEVAQALGIAPRLLHTGLPMARASLGICSLMVPLQDETVLDGLQPDLTHIRTLSHQLGVVSLYAYAPMGVNRFAARDFAPAVGISEDPVTGSAGGALMGLLAEHGLLPMCAGKVRGVIYQGHTLGSPGDIEVEVHMQGEHVSSIEVGGRAVLERQGVWRSELLCP